ncbi:MAG: HesB/IscA family protein [Gammaproteobacteria bacterium]
MYEGIHLTERAATHVKNFLAKNGGGDGLRVGVKTTGCSGYQYVVQPAEKIDALDRVFVSRGIKVVTDEESLRFLAGTELDFVREGLNAGFRFKNPNVQTTCGCGESFNIKDSAK